MSKLADSAIKHGAIEHGDRVDSDYSIEFPSLQRLQEFVESENAQLREELARLKVPMEPVAWIFKDIDSNTLTDRAHIAAGWEHIGTGSVINLFPAPPAFLIAEAEERGRKEALLEAADKYDRQPSREVFCGTISDELIDMANKE